MGNKNMILLIGIIILWFVVIRPLTRKKESGESESNTSDNGVSVSDNIQTYDRATEPNYTAGLNRTYTV